MEIKDGVLTFYAKSRDAWRQWLKKHHQIEKAVWLIIYRKESKIPTVFYPEAVDVALCFGWVDSKPNKRDHQSYYQFFAKRNPKSNWSKINKEKVERLIAAGSMTAAGYEMIEIAKSNGTWDALNDVEALVIPDDLKESLDQYPNARKHFDAFPPSIKRGILEWIFNAKQERTRTKRIQETAMLAEDNIRANQYKR